MSVAATFIDSTSASSTRAVPNFTPSGMPGTCVLMT